MTATLLSVNVGMPKDVSWRGRTVHTGVWKSPVTGPRMVRRLNIDGDGQGDLAGHGGEQRAVLVYQIESYRHWQEFLGRDDLEHGAFGENFTVEGLGDDEVCIGDRYRIGEAEFEVTQPRVTCFRVGMRMGEPQLPSLLVAHHRPGFYLRVLTEGRITAGDEIVRTRRGPHALTRGRRRCPAVPARARPGAAEGGAGHPRPQPGVARVVPEHAGRASRERRHPAGVAVAPPPAWAGFRTLTVTDVVAESASVTSFRFAADDAAAGVPARPVPHPPRAGRRRPGPGADVLPVGRPGRWPLPDQREARVARTGRAAYLHAHLQRGDRIEVAAPRGGFVLDEGTDPVLLISAGIGLTPVLAMLHRLWRVGAAPREVWWIHTTHDADSHAFRDRSRRADQPTAVSTLARLLHDSGAAARAGSGVRAGRLTAEEIAGLGLPADANAYVCGPESFMDDVAAALAGVGIDPARIHTERFGSRSPINPGVVGADAPPPHQPPGPPGAGPAVTFARSGLTAAWSDSYSSVLELAEACDVPTQWSCRTGVCHTCVTAVLSGEASYDTPPLEPPGDDELLICSARPTADLVIDL